MSDGSKEVQRLLDIAIGLVTELLTFASKEGLKLQTEGFIGNFELQSSRVIIDFFQDILGCMDHEYKVGVSPVKVTKDPKEQLSIRLLGHRLIRLRADIQRLIYTLRLSFINLITEVLQAKRV